MKSNQPLPDWLKENIGFSSLETDNTISVDDVFRNANYQLKEFHSPATVEAQVKKLCLEQGYQPTNCFIYLKTK